MIWTDGVPEYERLNQQVYRRNLAKMVRDVLPTALPIKKQSMLDWLEQEFVYPTGPKKGQRYDRRDQPATAILLDMMQDPYWRSCVLVAPNQCGKSMTLVQFVLGTLFNNREGVIFGIPDIDKMWRVKWQRDFLPAINASRSLKAQLPNEGSGSHGGVPALMLFRNGESLTVMGAGAGDTQRAGAESRVLVVTEFKDFGKSSSGSFEGSKLDQLQNRLRVHQGNEFSFAESTVTTDTNIAWTSYLEGTQTMVNFPCESCSEYVAPEREHLVGWQDARTEEEAREKTRFSCPVCGVLIEDWKRRELLQEAKALHKGQTVDRGRVVGDVPPTRKLSYRFSAATNMFSNSGYLGVEEWSNLHEKDSDRKQKRENTISQASYAWPVKESQMKLDPLDGHALMNRTFAPWLGVAPSWTEALWAGVDVRKTQMHYSVLATGKYTGAGRFIEWGIVRIKQDIPLRDAITQAGEFLQDRFRMGYVREGGDIRIPVSLTVIDSGYEQFTVQELCDLDDFWIPIKGQGDGEKKSEKYKAPNDVSGKVRFIGDQFDVKYLQDRLVVHHDASAWKSKLHAGLRVNASRQDAVTFAKAEHGDLREFVSQLTAETETFSNDSGESVSTWSKPTRANHFLDTSAYAMLAPSVWSFIQEMIGPEETTEWAPPRGDGSGLFG